MLVSTMLGAMLASLVEKPISMVDMPGPVYSNKPNAFVDDNGTLIVEDVDDEKAETIRSTFSPVEMASVRYNGNTIRLDLKDGRSIFISHGM